MTRLPWTGLEAGGGVQMTQELLWEAQGRCHG